MTLHSRKLGSHPIFLLRFRDQEQVIMYSGLAVNTLMLTVPISLSAAKCFVLENEMDESPKEY